MTKVLYISYDGMTDPLGQSQVLPYLKGLSEKGIEFHLISFEKEERFTKFKDYIQKICDDAGIHWYPLSYTKKPPLLSTIYDVQRMKRLAHKLHNNYQFSIIHCRSYIAAIVGAGMKKRFGTKFIFDMRGFWADERLDGGLWNLKNPLYLAVYRYFKKKETEFLKESSATISLTHAGKKEINRWETKLNENFSRIDVIPCCTDLNNFKLVERPNEATIIGYIGSLGTWYLLDEMLDFFLVYKRNFKSAKIHFLTKDNPAEILQKAKEKGISANDLIIEEASRDQITEKVKDWKASLFFIKPSFSKMASSPVKQGELMAMGVPVFCNSGVGDSDQIINQYHSGILVTTLDEKGYQNAIDRFENTSFESEKIRKGAEHYFSLDYGINAYLKIYDSISK